MIIIIYINELNIKSKINAIFYNIIMNEIIYQYLEKNIKYNIFIIEIIILQIIIEKL